MLRPSPRAVRRRGASKRPVRTPTWVPVTFVIFGLVGLAGLYMLAVNIGSRGLNHLPRVELSTWESVG